MVPVLLLAGASTAFGQSPNDLTRIFGVSQCASIQAARSEWKKISPPEIGCINDALRQHGARIETLIQRGVLPSDPKIHDIRSSCQQLPSGSKYVVAGLSLGSRVQFDSSDYQEYKCSSSEQFDGFTWCQKTRQERGFANVTYSMLHSQDGTLVYVNRFQEPAFFGRNEADEAIRQYSTKIGEKAQIKRLPPRRGVPEGILATWGKVALEPLDDESIKTLAEGRSPKKGYLIDFIGNFARSAKEGLPIFRISGDAGFLWLASFDPIGRGILRFAAVNPSASHATPLLNEAQSREAQVTRPDTQSAGVERTSTEAVFSRPEDQEAVKKARADVQVARSEAEAAKRDAQLAKADIEKLRAETANLNSAVERLQTEKTAVEGKARVMVFVVYGVTFIALLATISAILLVNRRRAISAKRQWAGPEIKPVEVTAHSPAVEMQAAPGAADLQGAKTGDTALFSPDLTQPLPSDATAQKSKDGSRSSDARSPSDTEEGRVILPI
jgi:hypothetical protein